MNKINIVTAPDQLFNDSFEILLLYPSKDLLNELQKKFLTHFDDDSNIYLYDKQEYNKEEVDWMLKIFKSVDVAIVDIDNCAPFSRDLVSYMLGKSKTFWLTNAVESVYNHISKNKVYDLDFLLKTGVECVKAH